MVSDVVTCIFSSEGAWLRLRHLPAYKRKCQLAELPGLDCYFFRGSTLRGLFLAAMGLHEDFPRTVDTPPYFYGFRSLERIPYVPCADKRGRALPEATLANLVKGLSSTFPLSIPKPIWER
jgi:hypothetical protein